MTNTSGCKVESVTRMIKHFENSLFSQISLDSRDHELDGSQATCEEVAFDIINFFLESIQIDLLEVYPMAMCRAVIRRKHVGHLVKYLGEC